MKRVEGSFQLPIYLPLLRQLSYLSLILKLSRELSQVILWPKQTFNPFLLDRLLSIQMFIDDQQNFQKNIGILNFR